MNQLFAFHNKLPFALSCVGSCSKNDDVKAVSSLCCACSHLLSVFHPMHRSVLCVPVDSVVPKWKKFETEKSLAVGNEGKQVGPLVFDVANNYPTKHKIQNHGLNEATANYQKGDPKPVEATASLSTHNQEIPSIASPQPRDKKEVENQCRWCIAKPSTSASKLDEIIQYCCTQYGIDCGVIQYGGACYTPATNKVSDASVVMNLYYNLAGKNDFNCYFGGSGLIVTQDP
ncbi:hypothetical protein C3L33_13057, partial [Rhododendron williamsianum]